MGNKALTIDEVRNLVKTNSYDVIEKDKLLSRCIDGRYENSPDLAPIGFPGGDIGQLAVIMTAANNFGFEIDLEKTYKTLIEIIGGEKNFGIDFECFHLKQINTDNKVYNLTKEQVDFLNKKAEEVKKAGMKKIILQDNHLERAVLLVYGNKSIMNQFKISGEPVQVFMFHQTLSDLRNKLLAEKLIEEKSVKLLAGLDAEYLYTALSETTEIHLMETVTKLAKGLPIYRINFKNDGQIEIVEMGVV